MNDENIFVNENEKTRTESTSAEQQQQQPWTKRMFGWMYNNNNSETPNKSPTITMNDVNQQASNVDDNCPELDEDDLPKIPGVTINSPSSLDVSTEFSSTSDSNDTHLVTITRLNEKGGLGNVIRKLRTGFKKEDDDLTRFWMPDSNSKECYECNFKFSAIRRRHHCRICGQIFCSRCCSKKIDGDKVGYAPNTKVRSCNYCFDTVTGVVNNCVKSNAQPSSSASNQPQIQIQEGSNESIDLESRLSNLKETNSDQNLPKAFHYLFGNEQTTSNEMNCFRSPKRSVDESAIANVRRLSIKKQQQQIEKELQSSTPNFINDTPMKERIDKRKKQLFISSEEQDRLIRTYEPSWVKEIDQKESSSFDNLNSEIESIEIVLNLVEDSNLITGLDRKINDYDYDEHYSVNKTNDDDEENKDEINSSNEQINKTDAIDNLVKNSAPTSQNLNKFNPDDQLNDDLIHSISNLFDRVEDQSPEKIEQDESIQGRQFDNVYDKFFQKLALQLLKKEKLSSSWFSILKDLVAQVTSTVKPNSDLLEEMDIRRHVKIKTITGGTKQDSHIINGVVFTKHVAHRKMRKEIENPKILLLNCPIVFQQRMYQKFISFDKLFLQENNYLENLIEKIASFKPNIIVVDKIVSIKAQELLCKKKITVVYNVKSNILFKISRLTNGEIVDSIDAQINCPKFGECESFYLKTFNNNHTLMFFDGCKPNFGCTILLRGSIFKNELKKVKKILKFLIFCDYNWKYEKAFLLSSSASLDPTTLNDFEQYYDHQTKENGKTINTQVVATAQENSKEIALTELNNSDNLDPLMNNAAVAANISQEQKYEIHKSTTSVSKENLTDMINFLTNQILSISPFIYYKLPYLLTSESDRCLIKKYISYDELFKSIRFQEYVNSNKICLTVDDAPYKKEESLNELKKNEMHPFLLTDLKSGVDSEYAQTLRALYRSSDTIELSNQAAAAATTTAKIANTYDTRDNDDDNCKDDDDNDKEDINLDPFDIYLHQLFPILYCNYSLNTTQNPFCIKPIIMQMEFYVEHDFSLGTYLRRYCFNKNMKCECGDLSIEHISKFSHTYGSIYVRCKELKALKRPNSDDIITWSHCQICKKSSQSKILNKNALSLSFGKFLQLKIYGNHFKRADCEQPCLNHSLFHDHFQYFAYRDMVASFKYYPVMLREIVLPCLKLNVQLEIPQLDQLQIEFQELHKIGFQIMSKIFEQICAYQAESDHDNDIQFKSLFAAEVKNRFELKKKLDEIRELIESEHKTPQLRLTIMNRFVLLKQLISSFVTNWNDKLNEYEANRKKDDYRLSSVVKNSKFPRLHSIDVDQMNSQQTKLNVRVTSTSGSYSRQNSTTDQHPIIKELLEASITNEMKANSSNLTTTNSKESGLNNLDFFSNDVDDEKNGVKKDVDSTTIKTTDQQKIMVAADENQFDKSPSLLNRSISSESISSIVFGYTPGIRAFLGNEIVCNSESDRENYEVVHGMHGRIPNIEISDDNQSIERTSIGEQQQQQQQQQLQKQTKEDVETKNQITLTKLESKLNNLQVQTQAMNLVRNQSIISQQQQQKKSEPIKSVKSILNNFLSSSNALIIEDPFLSTQHYLLPMREKLPIILDDNDIGSIIAYSLTTMEYERKLYDIQSSLNSTIHKTRYNSQTGTTMLSTTNYINDATVQKDNLQQQQDTSTKQDLSFVSVSVGTAAAAATVVSKELQFNDNIEVQFNDSTTNYYCCIHFASQFRKLRAEVLNTNENYHQTNQSENLFSSSSSSSLPPHHQSTTQTHDTINSGNIFNFDTEEAYIRSISQTIDWVAKGGKSKASFSKTINDRFVIKVVRKTDISLFTLMANSYFDYMHRSIVDGKPTLFAKIIGAYNVSWKDNVNNTTMKKYVLIMENVFYNRKIKQKFDLKGSEKNRLATTKTSDDVLLDENLTKIIRDNPFYIRNHSKLVLKEAINNDSKFLCDLNVIDYSLLVGIDEERKELVVAIIDYIQTYTSIKRFETVIKSMGGKVLPTVVDPQSYMERFRNKMNQYFQCLPDQYYAWYGIVFNLSK